MSSSILVVDDEGSVRRSLARLLRGSGYSVRVADCGRVALGEARRADPDLVLLDICLPDINGLEVLARLKEMNRRVVVIAMTAYESARDAVVAIKRGAYDYLSKPFSIEAVRLSIRQALADRCASEQPGPGPAGHGAGSARARMIGASAAMGRVLDVIRRLPADSDSNVLAEGETGTGKELLARAIHEASCRAAGDFVAVSCAAIPRDLLESELFGYEAGAFTGARPEGKPGVFEQAAGGTIFLDEIGELRREMQAKLLRVLEAREFARIGGLKRIPLRARIIAATNRDLRQEVRRGRFRPDLYYRLSVVTITLPPLRQRRADIIPLAQAFLREFSARFSRKFARIAPLAGMMLERYDWPGNVRELRNVIERVVLMEEGPTVLPEHLPEELAQRGAAALPAGGDSAGAKLVDLEKECIEQALRRSGGNVAKAARLLGLRRGALRYRMDKHGIAREGVVPSA